MSVVVDILVCLAFVVGTIALSLGAYFLMRFVTGGDPNSRHKEMANAMIIRVAALHGLILALVFAHEMAGYQQLKTQSATEANAVADVYYDIARYDPELAPPLRGALIEYLNVVVDTEWPTLGATGRLAADAWANWDRAYGYVLDLQPISERQTSLRDHMLERLHAVSEARNLRENSGADSINNLFWFAAISGVILIAVGYYYWPPERHNLMLMGLFSTYTGIILFMIFAFSDPFSPPGALTPIPFERLLQDVRE